MVRFLGFLFALPALAQFAQREAVCRGTVFFRTPEGKQEPADNVTVLASGPSGRVQARTLQGGYEFRGLSVGNWEFRAFAKGYCQENQVRAFIDQRGWQWTAKPIYLSPCDSGLPPSNPPVESSSGLQKLLSEGGRVFPRPDGQLAAVVKGHELWIRDVSSGSTVTEVKHGSRIHEVTFSLNGKYFATASEDDTACVWDLQGRRWAALVHKTDVKAVAFSQRGDHLATGADDGIVRIWEIRTGRTVAQWPAYAQLSRIAFSAGDSILLVQTEKEEFLTLRWEGGYGKPAK